MANSNNNFPSFGERTIDAFRTNLVGGGARPNLFEVEMNFPAVSGQTEDTGMRFMIKAAQLPASNVGVIDIPFRGRNLKIAGDRTFDPWTITVINDVDFRIRNAFEVWMNTLNKLDDNAGVITPNSYMTNMRVFQLGRGFPSTESTPAGVPSAGTTYPILKSYEFKGVFPSAVSAIDLSYDSSDTIEEFTVDLQVQWYDSYIHNGATTTSIMGTSTDTSTSPNV